MFWQKIGNSVSDRLFRDSMIVEDQCLYIFFPLGKMIGDNVYGFDMSVICCDYLPQVGQCVWF